MRYAVVESSRGKRVRHRAFASPAFRGLRFVIVPTPPGVVFVRFYDARGKLIGIDFGQAGYIGAPGDVTYLLGDREVGVSVGTETRIAPTPDQADRLRTLACVDLTDNHGGNGACDAESDGVFGARQSCDGPSLFGGIVPAGVASVQLTLGSGAHMDVPVRDLPDGFSGRRAFGGNTPAGGEAIRDATALDAAGEAVQRVAVGMPPNGQPCPGTDQGDDVLDAHFVPLAPPAGAAAVATAGGAALLVADQGAEGLCVGVGVGSLPATNCPPAPFDSDEPDLYRTGDVIGGALSRGAARVTLRLDRGSSVTVSTVDGAAYTGRWAGRLRFFAAAVPAGARLRDRPRRRRNDHRRIAKRTRCRTADRCLLFDGGGLGLQLVRYPGQQPCVSAVDTDDNSRPGLLHRPASGHPDRRPLPRVLRRHRRVLLSPRGSRLWPARRQGRAAPGASRRRRNRHRHAHQATLPRRLGRPSSPDATVLGFRAGKSATKFRLPTRQPAVRLPDRALVLSSGCSPHSRRVNEASVAVTAAPRPSRTGSPRQARSSRVGADLGKTRTGRASALAPAVIHRAVGGLDEVGERLASGQGGETNAHRHRVIAGFALLQRASHTLAQVVGLRGRDADQHGGELVAADAGDDVGLAHGVAQDARRRDERGVAGGVAEPSLIAFRPSRSMNRTQRGEPSRAARATALPPSRSRPRRL